MIFTSYNPKRSRMFKYVPTNKFQSYRKDIENEKFIVKNLLHISHLNYCLNNNIGIPPISAICTKQNNYYLVKGRTRLYISYLRKLKYIPVIIYNKDNSNFPKKINIAKV